jgi:hypothetical protein
MSKRDLDEPLEVEPAGLDLRTNHSEDGKV